MHPRAKVAAAAIGATLFLSSCSLVSAITTSEEYNPSDGTAVTVSEVRALNLLLIGTSEGEPAALVGYLYNDNPTANATVTVAVGDTERNYVIAPLGSVQLGLGEGAVEFITEAPADPGLFSTYTVTVRDVGASTGALPIVDGTLPQYQDVLEELPSATE